MAFQIKSSDTENSFARRSRMDPNSVLLSDQKATCRKIEDRHKVAVVMPAVMQALCILMNAGMRSAVTLCYQSGAKLTQLRGVWTHVFEPDRLHMVASFLHPNCCQFK